MKEILFNQLCSTVRLSHDFILPIIKKAGTAVDATAGNGKDTLFMAQHIKEDGLIYAFDIQERAITNTKKLLADHKLLDKVMLVQQGHENLGKVIKGKIDLVVFNLGYLPGGDHQIITKPQSTIKAVDSSLNMLNEGGRIIITVYPGHFGGEEEKESLLSLFAQLDQKYFKVLKLTFLNLSDTAPFLVVVEKLLR